MKRRSQRIKAKVPRPTKSPVPQAPVTPFPRETTDPRKAPDAAPIARPDPEEPYPTEGLPYPDPENPPELPDAPTLLSLDPDSAVLGSPDFTIRALGSGFTAESVIVWNGSVEVTTYVSATELTTGVNMATATVATTVPVAVRGAGGLDTASLPFTFVAAPAP